MSGQEPFCEIEGAEPLPETDRREAERYYSNRKPPVRFIARPSTMSRRAFVRDVSARGLGLITDHPVEVGTLLAIQLCSATAGASYILSATVQHVTPHLDGIWLVGCSLSRNLTDEEIFALL
jgi:hypothetical protein